jgi:D-3-phosphoglycerate dehydrogenase
VVLNGINVPRIAPSEVALVGPYLELTNNLASFLVQTFPGRLRSLRLTLQGAVPESSSRSLTLAMLAGALSHRVSTPVTPVNAEQVAENAKVRVFTEASSMKRDFMGLVRVEALIDEVRHHVTGTVLGHRHGRMVEIDNILMDAIPEGPALVTFHADRPGMLGEIGIVLGQHGANISRMQLGDGDDHSVAIFNLGSPVTDAAFDEIQALQGIHCVRNVR